MIKRLLAILFSFQIVFYGAISASAAEPPGNSQSQEKDAVSAQNTSTTLDNGSQVNQGQDTSLNASQNQSSNSSDQGNSQNQTVNSGIIQDQQSDGSQAGQGQSTGVVAGQEQMIHSNDSTDADQNQNVETNSTQNQEVSNATLDSEGQQTSIKTGQGQNVTTEQGASIGQMQVTGINNTQIQNTNGSQANQNQESNAVLFEQQYTATDGAASLEQKQSLEAASENGTSTSSKKASAEIKAETENKLDIVKSAVDTTIKVLQAIKINGSVTKWFEKEFTLGGDEQNFQQEYRQNYNWGYLLIRNIASVKKLEDDAIEALMESLIVLERFKPVSPRAVDKCSMDNDNDLLNNCLEETYGTDPNKADSDGDGLTDGMEILIYKTNALKKDTDDDGLTDYFEVQYYLQWNGSFDKEKGFLPNAPFNPLKVDANNNGIADGKDDADGDGVQNSLEQKFKTNPLKTDSDNDGITDYDEIFI
ncbi:hypothetical protein [Falsibacillus albus]|uniref:Uncharacterized protein n=1 Tax=Falsibacillus albus TaxID=2478915 RepID=A0A3L7JYJ6_9BACI|nr:hypothetical protein [Falsibacillus albus]RLQ94771.1 hypothetical protein D9X91_12310 [Falsibacillus albus]